MRCFFIFVCLLLTLVAVECRDAGRGNQGRGNGQGDIEKINKRREVSDKAEKSLKKQRKNNRGQNYQEYSEKDMKNTKKLLKCIRKESALEHGREDPKDDRLLMDDIIPTLQDAERQASRYKNCRVSRNKRNLRTNRQVGSYDFKNRLWSNGQLNYFIDSDGNISSSNVATIEEALSEISSATGNCVTFVKVDSSFTGHRVNIRSDNAGCFSFIGDVGMSNGQTLQLQDSSSGTCMKKGIIQHEFIHALGIRHEQTRTDRDTYVTINFQNIDPSAVHNFDKCPDCINDPFDYDYGSLMHYRMTAFSTNGQNTIDVKEAGASIGQRSGLSPLDAQLLKHLYCGGGGATPVNCVGSWSAYGSCSKTCGMGLQTRKYTISTSASNGGTACEASNGQTHSRSCSTNACPTPINCVGRWSAYDSCTKTCGGGTQTKTYTITTSASNGGTACEARNGQTHSRSCSTNECPIPINCVGSWSAYDSCTKTCGGGIQIKKYTITTSASNGGTACEASNRQTHSRSCSTNACPTPINCVGSWTAYDSCTKTCGGGTQTKMYTITTSASNGGTACEASNGQTHSRSCSTNACPAATPINCVGSWSVYDSCTKTCGGGTQTKTYTITTSASNGGTACEANNGQTHSRNCNRNECPITKADCGTCKTSQSSAGCSASSVQSCVCAVDGYCCKYRWDSICVREVSSVCGHTCA